MHKIPFCRTEKGEGMRKFWAWAGGIVAIILVIVGLMTAILIVLGPETLLIVIIDIIAIAAMRGVLALLECKKSHLK